MVFDLSIRGRVYGDGEREGWVHVKDGRIVGVSRERMGRAAAEMTLSDSQFLMPAATDLHVHLRDWGQAEKETVETGTRSAIAGGVTTVADMPNTQPMIDSPARVEERVALLRTKSYADFAVHASPPEMPEGVADLRAAGAFALKLYPPELGRFPELVRRASAARMKMVVHAEEFALTGTEGAAFAERVAIVRLLKEMGRTSDVRFAHVSTAWGASQLVGARRSHSMMTMEVTPHHLFVSDREGEERIGLARKVNPPLRPASSCARLRKMMRAGAFDFYATDHAPHTVKDKLEGAPGFPALEFALPLFLTKTRDIELVRRMYCEAPASYLGIPKGRVARGYAADLVVVGRRSWRIDPEKFVSKGRVTPFAGETMRFAVDQVFKAGRTVFDGRRFSRVGASLIAGGYVH